MDTDNNDQNLLNVDANTSSADMSVLEVSTNQDDTLNYQTADEENSSKYFSMIEGDSTLEGSCNVDVTLDSKVDLNSSSITESESASKPSQVLNSLANLTIESVNKLHIHERIDAANILSGGVDIFDDNENSLDEHELVIDDDAHPSEKSNDYMENSAEVSGDMRYKGANPETEGEEKEMETNFNKHFELFKKSGDEEIISDEPVKLETVVVSKESCDEKVEVEAPRKEVVEEVQEAEAKTDNYSALLQSNLPEGSSEVTLVIDDKNTEAIDIGEGVFIYKRDDGELTAIQITMNEDGVTNFKCLHVGKNEDGNLEVYEEQVNQVPVTNEELESMKAKELSNVNETVDIQSTEEVQLKDISIISETGDIQSTGEIQLKDISIVSESVDIQSTGEMQLKDNSIISETVDIQSTGGIQLKDISIVSESVDIQSTGEIQLKDNSIVSETVDIQSTEEIQLKDISIVSESVDIQSTGEIQLKDNSIVSEIVDIQSTEEIQLKDISIVSESVDIQSTGEIPLKDNSIVTETVNIQSTGVIQLKDISIVSETVDIQSAGDVQLKDISVISETVDIQSTGEIQLKDISLVSETVDIQSTGEVQLKDISVISEIVNIQRSREIQLQDISIVHENVDIQSTGEVQLKDICIVSEIVNTQSTGEIKPKDISIVNETVEIQNTGEVQLKDISNINESVEIQSTGDVQLKDIFAVETVDIESTGEAQLNDISQDKSEVISENGVNTKNKNPEIVTEKASSECEVKRETAEDLVVNLASPVSSVCDTALEKSDVHFDAANTDKIAEEDVIDNATVPTISIPTTSENLDPKPDTKTITEPCLEVELTKDEHINAPSYDVSLDSSAIEETILTVDTKEELEHPKPASISESSESTDLFLPEEKKVVSENDLEVKMDVEVFDNVISQVSSPKIPLSHVEVEPKKLPTQFISGTTENSDKSIVECSTETNVSTAISEIIEVNAINNVDSNSYNNTSSLSPKLSIVSEVERSKKDVEVLSEVTEDSDESHPKQDLVSKEMIASEKLETIYTDVKLLASSEPEPSPPLIIESSCCEPCVEDLVMGPEEWLESEQSEIKLNDIEDLKVPSEQTIPEKKPVEVMEIDEESSEPKIIELSDEDSADIQIVPCLDTVESLAVKGIILQDSHRVGLSEKGSFEMAMSSIEAKNKSIYIVTCNIPSTTSESCKFSDIATTGVIPSPSKALQSQSSVESEDDPEDDDFVEGEPVTGDSGVEWIAANSAECESFNVNIATVKTGFSDDISDNHSETTVEFKAGESSIISELPKANANDVVKSNDLDKGLAAPRIESLEISDNNNDISVDGLPDKKVIDVKAVQSIEKNVVSEVDFDKFVRRNSIPLLEVCNSIEFEDVTQTVKRMSVPVLEEECKIVAISSLPVKEVPLPILSNNGVKIVSSVTIQPAQKEMVVNKKAISPREVSTCKPTLPQLYRSPVKEKSHYSKNLSTPPVMSAHKQIIPNKSPLLQKADVKILTKYTESPSRPFTNVSKLRTYSPNHKPNSNLKPVSIQSRSQQNIFKEVDKSRVVQAISSPQTHQLLVQTNPTIVANVSLAGKTIMDYKDKSLGANRNTITDHKDKSPGANRNTITDHKDKSPVANRITITDHRDKSPGVNRNTITDHKDKSPGANRNTITDHKDKSPGANRNTITDHKDKSPGANRNTVTDHKDKSPGADRNIIMDHKNKSPGVYQNTVRDHKDNFHGANQNASMDHKDKSPGANPNTITDHKDNSPGSSRNPIIDHKDISPVAKIEKASATNIISVKIPVETETISSAEDSPNSEQKPQAKCRQPRKQVFTPVTRSDMEIIFPNLYSNAEEYKKESEAKALKMTYKLKERDIRFKQLSKKDPAKNIRDKSPKTSSSNCKLSPASKSATIDIDLSQSPERESKTQKTPDIIKTDSDQPEVINLNNSLSNSPLSSSAKRKRGRPKKNQSISIDVSKSDEDSPLKKHLSNETLDITVKDVPVKLVESPVKKVEKAKESPVVEAMKTNITPVKDRIGSREIPVKEVTNTQTSVKEISKTEETSAKEVSTVKETSVIEVSKVKETSVIEVSKVKEVSSKATETSVKEVTQVTEFPVKEVTNTKELSAKEVTKTKDTPFEEAMKTKENPTKEAICTMYETLEKGETTSKESPIREVIKSKEFPFKEASKSEDSPRTNPISPFGKINDNIKCPMCFKTFRTENVLLKHVKHCNGIIDIETIKSPRKRKITIETPKDDLSCNTPEKKATEHISPDCDSKLKSTATKVTKEEIVSEVSDKIQIKLNSSPSDNLPKKRGRKPRVAVLNDEIPENKATKFDTLDSHSGPKIPVKCENIPDVKGLQLLTESPQIKTIEPVNEAPFEVLHMKDIVGTSQSANKTPEVKKLSDKIIISFNRQFKDDKELSNDLTPEKKDKMLDATGNDSAIIIEPVKTTPSKSLLETITIEDSFSSSPSIHKFEHNLGNKSLEKLEASLGTMKEKQEATIVLPAKHDPGELNNLTEKVKTISDKASKEKTVGGGRKLLEKPPTAMASPLSRLAKIMNTKPVVNSPIECEICGKTFRQLAHMVYHRTKHTVDEPELESEPVSSVENPKATTPKKPIVIEDQIENSLEPETMLKCEICQKGFRKLHHLVEHRELHVNSESRSRRTSVASVKSEPESAGFRCDTCDKSFRKLHHLVEHRELHIAEALQSLPQPATEPKPIEDATCSGCGKSFRKRHHMVEHRDIHCSPSKKGKTDDSSSDNNIRLSVASSTSEDGNNCGICGKSYRKLHHMVEHRESHTEVREEKSTSLPEVLNTKDIIHECSRCYMVFPNENSLNKHVTICSRKKLLNKSKSMQQEIMHLIDDVAVLPDVLDISTQREGEESALESSNTVSKLEPMITHASDNNQALLKLNNSNDVSDQNIVAKDQDLEISVSPKHAALDENVPAPPTNDRTLPKRPGRRSLFSNDISKAQVSKRKSLNIDSVSTNLNAGVQRPLRKSLVARSQESSKIEESEKRLYTSCNLRKSTSSVDTVTSRTSSRRSVNSTTSIDSKDPIRKTISSKDSTASKLKIPLRKSLVPGFPAKSSSTKAKPLAPVKTISKVAVRKSSIQSKDEEPNVKYMIKEPMEAKTPQPKYKINPDFNKPTRRLSQPLAVKNVTKTIIKPRKRVSESVLSGLKLPSAKMLKAIIEESDIRYSFPKSPKLKSGSTDQSAAVPSTSSSSTKKPVLAKVSSQLPKMNENARKSKKVISSVLVSQKRKSLGGRNSIDVKKLPGLPKKVALQLRCCGQVFTSQANLSVHRKTHKVVRQAHKCDCGKAFETEGLLKRHIHTEHTPPKSFKCLDCGASVRTAAQFAKHKKVHETHPPKANASKKVLKTTTKLQTESAPKIRDTKKVPAKIEEVGIKKGVKRKIAHGGVPLSDKMRKAMAGVKF